MKDDIFKRTFLKSPCLYGNEGLMGFHFNIGELKDKIKELYLKLTKIVFRIKWN